jgi:23S rRNA (cytosine1962-C5)-methyltransferase
MTDFSPPSPASLPRLSVKRGHDRRLLRGHPWIFSNELEGSFSEHDPGSLVRIHDGRGRFQGIGYLNPRSLIAVRMLRRTEGPIDAPFLAERLDAALALRRRLYADQEAVRLIYSESDGFPGLVVDRYGDHLAVQVTTAGMERLLPIVLELLQERLRPRCVVARNDSPFRPLEGLEEGVSVLAGAPAAELEVVYNGLRLPVDILGGQKTGLFLDQRDNQRRFLTGLEGAEMLDAYCYQGIWTMLGLQAGAHRAVGVDASAQALEMAQQTALSHGLNDRIEWQRSEVLAALKAFRSEGRRFDLVVLDPPAFARNRKHVPAGLRGYLDLNRKGIDVVAPGGVLITCSCSHPVTPAAFRDTVAHAASLAGRHVRLLAEGRQSADHPALLTAPETDYLKCLVLGVE